MWLVTCSNWLDEGSRTALALRKIPTKFPQQGGRACQGRARAGPRGVAARGEGRVVADLEYGLADVRSVTASLVSVRFSMPGRVGSWYLHVRSRCGPRVMAAAVTAGLAGAASMRCRPTPGRSYSSAWMRRSPQPGQPVALLAADRLGRGPRCSPAWPGRKVSPAACHGPGCGDLMRRLRR